MPSRPITSARDVTAIKAGRGDLRQTPAMSGRIAPLLAVAVFWALAAGADGTRCAGTGLHVAAPPETVPAVCAAARAATDRLARCGLPRPRGVTIRVLDRLPEAPAACIGRFICDPPEIRVLSPEALARRADLPDDYGPLPPARVFRSLVAHEIAHASLWRASSGRTGTVAQEYVASVMQLQVMSAAERDGYLSRWPVAGPVGRDGLSPMILALSPGAFAARAWAHFSAPGNGCAFIRQLASGETELDVPEL